jgi:hypothetical protein
MLLGAIVVDVCQGIVSNSKVAIFQMCFPPQKKLLRGIMLYEQRQRTVPDSQLRLLASENLNADA